METAIAKAYSVQCQRERNNYQVIWKWHYFPFHQDYSWSRCVKWKKAITLMLRCQETRMIMGKNAKALKIKNSVFEIKKLCQSWLASQHWLFLLLKTEKVLNPSTSLISSIHLANLISTFCAVLPITARSIT